MTTGPLMVFGLGVGDVVRTSYDSGPYTITSLTPPAYTHAGGGGFVVRTWPVFSLIGSRTPSDGGHIVNDIRRLDDGRYFTDANDEVVVVARAAGRLVLQMDLFGTGDAILRPWPEDFIVDGAVFPWAWTCLDHHLYLGPILDHARPPLCPECGRPAYSTRVMELLPRPTPPERPQGNQRNSFHLELNTPGLHVHPALVVTRSEVPA